MTDPGKRASLDAALDAEDVKCRLNPDQQTLLADHAVRDDLAAKGFYNAGLLEAGLFEDFIGAGLNYPVARALKTAFSGGAEQGGGGAGGGGGAAVGNDVTARVPKKMRAGGPSDQTNPRDLKGELPRVGQTVTIMEEDGRVQYYTARPLAVPTTLALPVALAAPEFGILLDAANAANGYSGFTPPYIYYQVATELCDAMAKIYDREELRQDAFITIVGKLGIKVVYYRSGSTASSSRAPVLADGDCHVLVGNTPVIYVLLEVKVELNADPTFQLLRYIQNLNDGGKRWGSSPLQQATGAPCLLVDLAGPNLVIHGAFIKETNVIVSEPLTPRLEVLPLTDRQAWHTHQVACILAGFTAAAQQLRRRYQIAGARGVQQADMEVLRRLQACSGIDYKQALQRAHMTPAQIDEVAAQRQQSPRLLPYALSGSIDCTDVVRCDTDGHEKLLFTARWRGVPAFVKFTPRRYPDEIHRAWHSAGVAPELLECLRLPGDACMVVMELLDPEHWCPLYVEHGEHAADPQEQAALLAAVKSQLDVAHRARVPHDARATVHGDIRGPNIMVRRRSTGTCGWDVKFVDFDWAGFEGVGQYPPLMSTSISWHSRAKPGRHLEQEHDTSLLQDHGTTA